MRDVHLCIRWWNKFVFSLEITLIWKKVQIFFFYVILKFNFEVYFSLKNEM